MSKAKFQFARPRMLDMLCAVLLIVMICLQFTPFWSYYSFTNDKGKEKGSIVEFEGSELITRCISEYVWMPTSYAGLKNAINEKLTEQFPELIPEGKDMVEANINAHVGYSIAILAASLIGTALFLVKMNKSKVSLLAIIAGLLTVVGYLHDYVLRVGETTAWTINFALGFVILAAGVFAAIKYKTWDPRTWEKKQGGGGVMS